jgi:hypothetical protein
MPKIKKPEFLKNIFKKKIKYKKLKEEDSDIEPTSFSNPSYMLEPGQTYKRFDSPKPPIRENNTFDPFKQLKGKGKPRRKLRKRKKPIRKLKSKKILLKKILLQVRRKKYKR